MSFSLESILCTFSLRFIFPFLGQKAQALSTIHGYTGYGAEQGEKVFSGSDRLISFLSSYIYMLFCWIIYACHIMSFFLVKFQTVFSKYKSRNIEFGKLYAATKNSNCFCILWEPWDWWRRYICIRWSKMQHIKTSGWFIFKYIKLDVPVIRIY